MVAIDDNILQLVRRARLGDRKSMEALAVLVQERVYPYILRLMGDQDLSWDILQETQLVMVRSLGTLHKERCFWPWIYRIARNTVQQHYRDQGRRRAIQMSALGEAEQWAQEDGGNSGGLKLLMQCEKRQRLRQAVGRLRQKYREVVQWRCYDQMSYTGIAVLAACSPQQARMRFHRAKHALRENLGSFF